MIENNRLEMIETEAKINKINLLAQRSKDTQKELQERIKGIQALSREMIDYEDQMNCVRKQAIKVVTEFYE